MAPIIPMSIEANRLLLLLTWMSPAFPVGAFAYSHGLEWAIEDGTVQSADDLRIWIEDVITRGSGWNDAVLFARCWEDEPSALNELALALCGSRERYLETTQLGRAFEIAVSAYSPPPLRGRPTARSAGGRGDSQRVADAPSPALRATSPTRGEVSYSVAVGTACAGLGIARDHALLAYLQGFCSTLTSVAVRLVPLGQTAGLEVLRDLMPRIAATAKRAATATLGDLGAITLLADIAAMKHETLHARVFRT